MQRHLVLVTPPAVERAGNVWDQITPHTIIVCGDYEQAVEWADAAPAALRAHAVTGLARTAALLKEGRVGILTGSYPDLAALVARAALKLDTIDTIVLAWPEAFADELDTLLAEAAGARRVVLSWSPTTLDAFFERHARRPEIVGDLPLDDVGQPLGPVASARYAIVAAGRKRVRDVLDVLRALRPYVWTGGPVEAPAETPDAVVAAVLPTRDELRQLAGIAPTTVVVLASQLAYLRSIATLTSLTLPSPADRAQDRNAQLRAQIAARLRQGGAEVDAELEVLAPLFEEHAPAMVAAALLAISRQPAAAAAEPASSSRQDGWVRLFMPVGTKDRASAKDLVGALIKEAGLLKEQIGKIDMRDKFSLVEIAPAVADQAIQRMSGVSIRGRRVAPRRDRP